MKTGRRLAVLIAAVVFGGALLRFPAAAAEKRVYELDGPGISIAIPEDALVITRDTPADDPLFSILETTKEEFDAGMAERDQYLDAYWDEMACEFLVSSKESELNDFSSIGDFTLETLTSLFTDSFKPLGITVLRTKIYHHPQTKFIKLYTSVLDPNSGRTVYGLTYSTVCNHKAINLILQSYSKGVTVSMEALLKELVDSVTFHNPAATVTPEPTEAFVYTDEDMGVSFTVPKNWIKGEFTKEREFLTAKFKSNVDISCSILYSGMDMWSEMTWQEKRGRRREDVTISHYSSEEILQLARGLGLEQVTVSKAVYGGVEYFKLEGISNTKPYGIELSLSMTWLLRIDNGYYYLFQFSGRSDHALFPDFEQLVESAVYTKPTAESSQKPSQASSAAPKTSPADKKKTASSAGKDVNLFEMLAPIFVGAAFLIVFFTFLIVLSRKETAKQAQREREDRMPEIPGSSPPGPETAGEKPLPYFYPKNSVMLVIERSTGSRKDRGSAAPAAPKNTSGRLFCPRCGASLPPDSAFCHKCGEKVMKEV